jgi:hypothetical protein
MLFKRKNDLQCVDRTIILLSKFHAVPLDNEHLVKKYRNLFALKAVLQKGKFNV